MRFVTMFVFVFAVLGMAACDQQQPPQPPENAISAEEIVARETTRLELEKALVSERNYNALGLASFDQQAEVLPEKLTNPDEERSDYPIVNLWAEARTSIVFSNRCLDLADRYIRQMRSPVSVQRFRNLEHWSTELLSTADSSSAFAPFAMLLALSLEDESTADYLTMLFGPIRAQACTNREAVPIPPELEDIRLEFSVRRYFIMEYVIDVVRVRGARLEMPSEK
jgi:hypothetical protein